MERELFYNDEDLQSEKQTPTFTSIYDQIANHQSVQNLSSKKITQIAQRQHQRQYCSNGAVDVNSNSKSYIFSNNYIYVKFEEIEQYLPNQDKQHGELEKQITVSKQSSRGNHIVSLQSNQKPLALDRVEQQLDLSNDSQSRKAILNKSALENKENNASTLSNESAEPKDDNSKKNVGSEISQTVNIQNYSSNDEIQKKMGQKNNQHNQQQFQQKHLLKQRNDNINDIVRIETSLSSNQGNQSTVLLDHSNITSYPEESIKFTISKLPTINAKQTTFWEYRSFDNNPQIKRQSRKPCRFWMGQCVRYYQNKIIERRRKNILQILINSLDHSVISKFATTFATQQITKGEITLNPSANIQLLELNQSITTIMAISKEYSFECDEKRIKIVARKGKNRIKITKSLVLRNNLSTECKIYFKIYYN